jgi:hypothetical protein
MKTKTTEDKNKIKKMLEAIRAVMDSVGDDHENNFTDDDSDLTCLLAATSLYFTDLHYTETAIELGKLATRMHEGKIDQA